MIDDSLMYVNVFSRISKDCISPNDLFSRMTIWDYRCSSWGHDEVRPWRGQYRIQIKIKSVVIWSFQRQHQTSTDFLNIQSEFERMKQAKLSFLRSNKRKAETNEATFDPQPKPKRVKEAAQAAREAQARKKPEPEKRETSKKKNVVQHLSTSNSSNKLRFSDNMKDAVKTLCRICKYAYPVISSFHLS